MSVLIGYLLMAVNVFLVIILTTDKLHIFFDFHAFLCVFGGTFLSSVVGFGPTSLKHLFSVYRGAIAAKKPKKKEIISEIVSIAKDTKGDISPQFVSSYKGTNIFLKEGLGMIADGFSKEQISQILEERMIAFSDRDKDDEKIMKALTKIPPSMGLTGTTIGLIALFAEVGGADSISKIGPAMAVALTATLYGVLCAFMILNPMTEKVQTQAKKEREFREVIVRGVLLLKEKAPPIFIEEVLKSHLTAAEQLELSALKPA